MKTHELKTEMWLEAPIEKVFEFFSDASNLDAITPAWVQFRIVTLCPIRISEGTLINYKLRIRGIPIRWQSRITVWDPPYRFVDEQVKGPYRRWIHEHAFEQRYGGTVIRDRVNYAVPFDWLVHRWFVRPDVERIFRFREQALKQKFPPTS